MNRNDFMTRAIHSGEGKDPATGAHNTPIYQTATFTFDRAEELTDAFASPYAKFFYSREGNPTVARLEEKLATLIGSEDSLATASGMAAVSLSVTAIAKAGDHIVVSNATFINSYQFFTIDCPDLGIEVSLVDIQDFDAIEGAMRPNTKLIFTEIFVNPKMELVDIKALRRIADEHDLKLVVDNTFLSPYLYRPIELGADLVVHSATKYLCGHGDTLGGVVAGDKDTVMNVREKLTRFGQVLSPFNAWLILRGIRTLPLRMRQHTANAQDLATYLFEHPKVESVRYPSLPSQSNSDFAKTQLANGFGGMLLFKVAGGFDEMCRVMEATKLAGIGTSFGDLFTLINPVPEFENSIRVSVGCEASEDIVADFAQALEQI